MREYTNSLISRLSAPGNDEKTVREALSISKTYALEYGGDEAGKHVAQFDHALAALDRLILAADPKRVREATLKEAHLAIEPCGNFRCVCCNRHINSIYKLLGKKEE